MSKNVFNFEKIGTPVAKVIGGRNNGKVLYLYSPLPTEELEDILNPLYEIQLEHGSIFQPILNPYTERMVGYFTGRSGSGKSYQIGKFLEQYKKARKNNKIYLFSPVTDDEALDKHITKRIALDKSLYEQPFSVDTFENTCLIFDDTDTITDKKIKNAVYNLMNSALERGRHHNITVLVVNHLGADRNTTKRILNESHFCCWFPSNINANLKYMLENYVGLDKNEIKKCRETESRHCFTFKNYPLFNIVDRKAWICKNID